MQVNLFRFLWYNEGYVIIMLLLMKCGSFVKVSASHRDRFCFDLVSHDCQGLLQGQVYCICYDSIIESIDKNKSTTILLVAFVEEFFFKLCRVYIIFGVLIFSCTKQANA